MAERNTRLFTLNFVVTLGWRGVEQGASPEIAVRMSANFLSCSSSVFMQMTKPIVSKAVPSLKRLQTSCRLLFEVGLEMNIRHHGGTSKTVAMFIPAHGCSAQDGDTSNVILYSGGTITFVEKVLVPWELGRF